MLRRLTNAVAIFEEQTGAAALHVALGHDRDAVAQLVGFIQEVRGLSLQRE